MDYDILTDTIQDEVPSPTKMTTNTVTDYLKRPGWFLRGLLMKSSLDLRIM